MIGGVAWPSHADDGARRGQAATAARRQRSGDPAHAGRPSRSAGHVRPGDADAARAAGGTAAGAVRRGGGEAREGVAARKSSSATRRSRRSRRAADGRRRIGRPGGQRRRLQHASGSTRGSHYTTVDGQNRASIVVDPPDGRVPAMTPSARSGRLARNVRADLGSAAREDDPGFEAARCLRRPGAASARRALPAGVRLDVGTAGAAELLLQQPPPDRADAGLRDDPDRDGPRRAHRPHERASICRRRRSASGWAIRSATGKATRWSSTRRISPTRPGIADPRENLHVVERFTRVDAKTLLYRFTIEDPNTWERPWTGEYTWPATDERMYEYACHEGNYALGNILRGARLKEADEAKKTKQ